MKQKHEQEVGGTKKNVMRIKAGAASAVTTEVLRDTKQLVVVLMITPRLMLLAMRSSFRVHAVTTPS